VQVFLEDEEGAGERLVELAERAGARPILASRRRYQRGISFIDLKTGEAFQPWYLVKAWMVWMRSCYRYDFWGWFCCVCLDRV